MDTPASDQSKEQIENQVVFLLGNSDSTVAAAITTKKYLTAENQFVYLTRTAITTTSIPSIKIQVYGRIKGGVHEIGYLLYQDHRFERYDNSMVFGQNSSTDESAGNSPVSQPEAEQLLQLLAALGPHNQKI